MNLVIVSLTLQGSDKKRSSSPSYNNFPPPFSLSITQLEQTVTTAFMQASEVASALNIHHQHIIPNWIPDHTPIHNQQLQKLTLAIQKTIHSGQTSNEEESPHPQTPPMPQSNLPSSSNSDNLLLEYTLAAMKISEPSKLLTLATHTLYTSCGFERVLLAFAVPGKEKLEAKICYGAESDAIQAAFHCPLNKGNFWYCLLQQYHPIQFLS